MFGIVAVRIFLNIAKFKFFIGRMDNHDFYRYYAKWTQKRFDFCCTNVNLRYADSAISYLKPVEDYDPSHFKVCNLRYIYYLEKLKEKCS